MSKINKLGAPLGAWSLEISVAIIGLVIAVANTSIIMESIVELSVANLSNLVVIGSVLLVSALIELTKIPFMRAFMVTKRKSWRLGFFVILMTVSFITFETLSNGFISAFDARNRSLNVLIVDINEKEGILNSIGTGSSTENPFPAQIKSLKESKEDISDRLNSKAIPLRAELERLRGLKAEDKSALMIVLESKRSSQSQAQQALTTCKASSSCWDSSSAQATLNKANKELSQAESDYSAPSKFDSKINQTISEIANIESRLAKDPEIVDINGQIEDLKKQSLSFVNNIVNGDKKVENLGIDISKLNKQLDMEGRSNFTYSISKFFEISLNDATTWLSVLVAFVITIVGPAMAASHYLPAWVNFFKPRKERKSRIRALARSIILKKRKAIVKEVEVEVVKEVEIIKEVEVEVVKEVEVVVEKTIVKHVPVYTNNEDLLELSNVFINQDTEEK